MTRDNMTRAEHAAYMRAFTAKRISSGICIRCATPVTGSVMCAKCNQKNRDNVAMQRRKRFSSGLCYEFGCNRQMANGTLRCAQHNKEHNKRAREYKWRNYKRMAS